MAKKVDTVEDFGKFVNLYFDDVKFTDSHMKIVEAILEKRIHMKQVISYRGCPTYPASDMCDSFALALKPLYQIKKA